jgi:hypothetical protein
LVGNLTISLGSSVFASQSKFELTIQRVKELDQIEAFPWSPWLLGQDGADWSWKVQFYNGNQWLPWENERSSGAQNPDANKLNQNYSWVFDTPSSQIIRFRIELWDSDLWPNPPDLADLSSKPGEGVFDWGGGFVTGAVFEGVYNFETMNFTSDSDFVQLRYNPAANRIMWVASGEYDGTYGSGGLDAEVWFEVAGEFHPEGVPSDIAVINVIPLKTLVTSPYPTYIRVDVRNNCSSIVHTYVDVYANNSVVGTQYVMLSAYEQESLTFIWQTAGFEGTYIVSALARQLPDEIDISNNLLSDGPVNVVRTGYFIIVAGSRSDGELNDEINRGCNQVYRTLLDVGFSKERIFYMSQPEFLPEDVDGDGLNDINDLASNAKLQRAIEIWARNKVDSTEPLFLYIFDHGGEDLFCIDRQEYLYSSQLASWLDFLQTNTGAQIHVIYAACHSGSFINDLSSNGRVIVTCCKPDEFGWADYGGEIFSIPFWNEIKSGHSIESSFNFAAEAVKNRQTPLLDDNGDGIGHASPVPNGGDGNLAQNIYIGGCEWPYPWISHVMPKITFTWPPTSDVEVWAQIENITDLRDVMVYMVPPDWIPPSPNETLAMLNFERFSMNDSDYDGIWTATIPLINFTKHATGPSQFKFLITATEENGDMATPLVTTVEFTNGTTPVDLSAPYIFVERPLTDQVVYDETLVNGTVSDDTCVSKIELWQEIDNLGTKSWNCTQTFTFSPESTSYFEFRLSTSNLPNNSTNILLRAYDTSGNYRDQNVTFLVNHDVHDIAVTNIQVPDVIEQGQLVLPNVTLANYGSYSESFQLDLYLNMTSAITKTVDLAPGASSTITLALNTTGFGAGCYTISSLVSPVVNETNTDNNLYVTSFINVTGYSLLRCDLNSDGDVNILDVISLCRRFGTSLGMSRYWENADLNADGRIDIMDAILFADHLGESTAE